jgi:GTP-binding protein
VGLNKLDLIDKTERRKVMESARTALHFAPWAPIVPISAKTGSGLDELMRTVSVAAEQFKRRVTTGALNRFFATVLERHPPPTHKGRAPRIYFITQAQSEPPLFVAMSNAPDHIKESYKRFVSNEIRKAFDFSTIPIRVEYRLRARRQ